MSHQIKIVGKRKRKLIKKSGHSTSVGDEGGFAPMIKNNETALKLITKSIKKSGFVNGKDISICLDVAANESVSYTHLTLPTNREV